MRLSSPDVAEGGSLSAVHGKKFDNRSPGLDWSDVPAGAASLVLTLIDVHPVARGYVHWFVDGIPPVDGGYPAGAGGAIPAGRELKPYAGPFPPSGTHDYVFTLYALDASAPTLAPTASVADFLDATVDHVLDEATLTASYTKPRT
jgi:Raf kinase inhibitor-like YbhB/YbcL family protein